MYTEEHLPATEGEGEHSVPHHIVYYDNKNYLHGSNVASNMNMNMMNQQPSTSSVDDKSQKSDQSEYEFRMAKRLSLIHI